MESQVKSIQIFVYNTYGITKETMCPMLSFSDETSRSRFITSLISLPSRRLTDEPYFVINNPQLLPYYVHRYHSHIVVEYDEDTGKNILRSFPSCFSVRNNLELLLRQNIDNNTNENSGFREVLLNTIM